MARRKKRTTTKKRKRKIERLAREAALYDAAPHYREAEALMERGEKLKREAISRLRKAHQADPTTTNLIAVLNYGR